MKKLLSYGPGLMLGIPTLGRPVPLGWALAFKSLNPPINYNTSFAIIPNQEVGVARQTIAEKAIEQNCKFLFFLGDDVEIPNHTLRSMIYRMEQDDRIGVISGVYCAKANPSFPLVFQGNGRGSYWDWKVGEFFEVTGIGMDCTLIRVDLLKQLAKNEKKKIFETVKGDSFMDGINAAEEWTEDLYFCNRVLEETDYKIYCDGGIICKHWDVYGNKFYSLPPDSLPMRQLVVDGNLPKLLDIGATLGSWEGYSRVTFGESDECDYRGQPTTLPFDNQEFTAVNIPGSYVLDARVIRDTFKESLRVLKPGGEIKITHSNAINQDWLIEILVAEGCDSGVKKSTSLIEAKKKVAE